MSFGFRPLIAVIACCFALAPPEAQAQHTTDFQQEGAATIAGLMIKAEEGKWARGELQELVVRMAQENSIAVVQLEAREGTGGWWHLELPRPVPEAVVRPLMEQLRLVPRILKVELNPLIVPASTPNDDGYTNIITGWEIRDDQPAGIRGEASYDIPGGMTRTATMTVLDSGMIPDAEVYAGAYTGWDFYANKSGAFDEGVYHPGGHNDPCGHDARYNDWHGLQVASIIAAITNNDSGMSSIGSWSAKGLTPSWVPVRIDGCKGGNLDMMMKAIRWSVGQQQGSAPAHTWKARVINISMSSVKEEPCPGYLADAISYAWSQKAVVVVAAGNRWPDGADTAKRPPANCPGAVVVTNHDKTGKRFKESNYGDEVTLSAPGSDVTVRKNDATDRPAKDGTYRTSTAWGTSVAAPFVTATLGRMFGANPALTNTAAVQILKDTARPFLTNCPGCGVGMLDAEAAITAAVPVGTPVSIKMIPDKVRLDLWPRPTCRIITAQVLDSQGRVVPDSSVTFYNSDSTRVRMVVVTPLTAEVCAITGGSSQITATHRNLRGYTDVSVWNSSCLPNCARKAD